MRLHPTASRPGRTVGMGVRLLAVCVIGVAAGAGVKFLLPAKSVPDEPKPGEPPAVAVAPAPHDARPTDSPDATPVPKTEFEPGRTPDRTPDRTPVTALAALTLPELAPFPRAVAATAPAVVPPDVIPVATKPLPAAVAVAPPPHPARAAQPMFPALPDPPRGTELRKP